MTDAEMADAIRALAQRVRSLQLVDRRRPERPFEQRDEIAADLLALVPDPGRRAKQAMPKPKRVRLEEIEVAGRRIRVQRPRVSFSL